AVEEARNLELVLHGEGEALALSSVAQRAVEEFNVHFQAPETASYASRVRPTTRGAAAHHPRGGGSQSLDPPVASRSNDAEEARHETLRRHARVGVVRLARGERPGGCGGQEQVRLLQGRRRHLFLRQKGEVRLSRGLRAEGVRR